MSARPFIRLNIRTRLVLLCLAVAMPLVAMSGVAVWKEYQTLKMQARQSTMFQASIAARTLSHWIAAQEADIQAIASVESIKRLPAGGARQILSALAQAQPGWQSLTLVALDGNVLSSNTSIAKCPSQEVAALPIFRCVIKQRKACISGYMTCPFTGQPAVLVAAPVFDGAALHAVAIASIEPHTVQKLFEGLGADLGSVIAVVDQSNRVLARTLNNDYWLGKDYSHARTVQAAVRGTRGTLETVGIADRIARCYAFDRAQPTGWLVIVGVPLQTIYGPAHDRLLIMLCLIGLALASSLLLAYAATGHFTKAISELVKEAVAIGRGDLSKRVHSNGADELGLLARAFNQMAAKLQENQEYKILVEKITDSIRRSLDLDQILNTTASELGEALEASRCCIALIDAKSPEEVNADCLVFNHVFWSDKRAGTPLKNRCLLITDDSLLKTIMEQGTMLSMDVLDDSPFVPLVEQQNIEEGASTVAAPVASGYPEDWKAIKSLLACPISTADKTHGLILIHQCDDLRVWSESEQQLVESVAHHVAVAMDHARLFAQVKHQAITDGLTGLYNHIHFKRRLGEELKRAQRGRSRCSLLMIDLDNLKQINDTKGHPAGDAAISQVARILSSALRAADTAARYGGEEFAVILPETSTVEAALIAKRLCNLINSQPVAGLGTISVSIGAATYPSDASSSHELLDKADRALYKAKAGGRNQVRVWVDELFEDGITVRQIDEAKTQV